jgi:F-type H+-transporting ATPase subunit O
MFARQTLFRAAVGVSAPTRIVARSFAAAATQDVKAPVSVFGVDGTYATALFTAASKSSTLDPTSKALTTLAGLISRDPKLAGIVAAPTLTPADKDAIVAELQKQAGVSGTGADTIKNFLSTLAENNRLGLLQGVADKFAVLVSAAKGEVEMVVTSAQPLDSRNLSRLEAAVQKSQHVGPGKKLKITQKVDPDILGGLIVQIGDRTIDLSVYSKVAKMDKLLQDTL